MKKTAIASMALAAALFVVSCQKEATPEQNVSGPMTISAVAEGLNTPTKTELAFKYDVLWSSTDKIYVVDGQGHNDSFKLANGEGTTKGTFTQEGSTQFTGEVQAYYPATMLESGSPVWPAVQTNDQTIPMYCKKTLSGTTDERMDFASLGSVLQIVFNTTQENVTLKSIEIKDGERTMSGAFTVEDGKAYITATDKAGITLDLGTGAALGKGANYFNIAVPAGAYQDLTLIFTATDRKKCTMEGGQAYIAYNTVGRLTLTGENFKSDVPAGALPGKFSVSATKQVYFSKGNLWADASGDNGSNPALHFEPDQCDFQSIWSASHVSYFAHCSTVEKAISESFDGDYLFCDENHKVSVDGSGAIYYALSKDEWTYLFSTRKMANNGARFENLMSGVTIEGFTFKGFALFPDNFTEQNTWKTEYTTWEALDNAGIVLLPAAGSCNCLNVENDGIFGYYWSSSAINEFSAFSVCLSGSGVITDLQDTRNFGDCIRLITDCDVTNGERKISLWKNENNTPVPSWGNDFYFSSVDNSDGGEIYAFPMDQWAIIKDGKVRVSVDADESSDIRITSGLWYSDYGGSTHNCIDMIQLEKDGTKYIELNIKEDGNLYDYIDEWHLLFTGYAYTLLELYVME